MGNVFRNGAEFGDILFFDSYSGTLSASTVQKRSGSYAYLQIGGPAYKYLNTPLSEFYARFAVRFSQATTVALFSWWDGAIQLGQVSYDSGTTRLKIYTSTGTLVGTGVITISPATWYLIEVHVKIADSLGDIEVKIDGVLDTGLDFSGDTKPGTATTIDRLGYRAAGGGGDSSYWDDLALNDTTGTVDNSWCGDGRIILLSPNGNGDITQLIGSDGNSTDNYLLVDDFPYDSDTTYVLGSGIGDYDLYNVLTSGVPNASIVRIWPESRSRQTIAGTNKIGLMIKTGGVEYTQSGINLITTYTKNIGSGYLSNPQTGLPWTDSDLNSIQVGIKILS